MTFNSKCPPARRLADKRDLQFGNQQPKAIEWAKLWPVQRAAFLRALLRGMDFLSEQAVVDLILRRRGEFDQAVEAPRRLMTPSVVQPLAEQWAECVRVRVVVGASVGVGSVAVVVQVAVGGGGRE